MASQQGGNDGAEEEALSSSILRSIQLSTALSKRHRHRRCLRVTGCLIVGVLAVAALHHVILHVLLHYSSAAVINPPDEGILLRALAGLQFLSSPPI
eukprot:CAMPEP_0118985912 /NCGR_PEP_ID=MMETSP1173-20130426/41006_1 /TAXON_ID=1034831 /ORGANISM="Rhizochromulina marina cf, Strain CCMP1243" /LENGTH=96 /DNA_ID=CAMNT_0006936657 /DNA_START=1 /DNA_END=288 /DNA_ORIENTATION=+